MPPVIACLGFLLLVADVHAATVVAPVLAPDAALGTAIDGLALGWTIADAAHVTISFRNTGETSVYLNLGLDLNGSPTFAPLRIAATDGRGTTRIGYLVHPVSYIGPFTPMVVPVLPNGRYSFTLPFSLTGLLSGDETSDHAQTIYSVSLIYDGSSMRHLDPTGEKRVSHASLMSNPLRISASIAGFDHLSDVESSQGTGGEGGGLWTQW
jgi:hypothetical protein